MTSYHQSSGKRKSSLEKGKGGHEGLGPVGASGSLHGPLMKQKQNDITKENIAIAQMLINVKPEVSYDEHLKTHKVNEDLSSMISRCKRRLNAQSMLSGEISNPKTLYSNTAFKTKHSGGDHRESIRRLRSREMATHHLRLTQESFAKAEPWSDDKSTLVYSNLPT